MTDTPDPPTPAPDAGRETAAAGRAAAPDIAAAAARPAGGAAAVAAAGSPRSLAPWRASLAWLLAAAAIVAAAVAAALAWQTYERVQRLEAELVRRQQAGTEAVAEARTLARQAQEQAREAVAKATLLELRVAEIGAGRQQVDELLQSMTRSRDEGVLAELDAGLRLAMHQASITGGVDAVLLSLRHAEERLADLKSPALERVRRAVAVDLERVRAAAAPDPAVLAARLDEVLRSVESLPLLSEPVAAADSKQAAAAPAARRQDSRQQAPTGSAAPADAADASAAVETLPAWRRGVQALWAGVRDETLALVRLRRIDSPEAALLAPEQAVYLRRHLELRLLGARVAVLARRHEAAQADLAAARALLDRYFDRRARAVQAASETLRQVAAQARTAAPPRPEATLAAIAAAGGR